MNASIVLSNFSTNSSRMLSSTNTRDPATQTCPALPRKPAATPRTATSRSASAKTTDGDLPPSSSVMRLSVSVAWRRTSLPVAVDPVKAIFATPGCATSA
ncbi:hypothetical protein RM812_00255 [Streptomyces sp. DSM 40712]|uniref:Uncharacterized protein n=1 Tax=Streptomyces lancefieldiae TaxID=3075520 RepID=A0ABU3AHX5_9ACTN|nr:hypothetical protein [Streptomyces sp. DSM 40712]MDT0608683.1 hypothetical protein [Streptomyces sp. DSM 40712]